MQHVGNTLILSATDLSGFLACAHLTTLEHRAELGGPKPPQFPDPGREVLQKRGHEHEQKFGRTSLILLVMAVAMAAGGWAGSTLGIDPAVAYRLAALLAAGGLLLGLVWISSAAMSEQGRGSGD